MNDMFGVIMKKYRESDLNLSQGDLAYLADVSRGTISNIETSRVNPDDRTWERIRTALGLARSSPDDFKSGDEMQPIFPTVAVQGILEAIMSIKTGPDNMGRRVAARWRHLVSILTQDGPPDPNIEQELSWLARDIAIKASPEKMQIIHSALQQLSLPPRSSTSKEIRPSSASDAADLAVLTRTVSGLSVQIRNLRDDVRGFDRLPVRVQDLLNHSLVVDYEVEREVAPGVAVADLVLVDEGYSPLIPRRDLIHATYRWSNILMVARYIVENLAPDKSPDEILSALKRVFEEDLEESPSPKG